MIATADTLEEVDGAAIVAGQFYMHEYGPSNMPPMPPPEPAAMDVDSDKQWGLLLTKKEERDIIDFHNQRPGLQHRVLKWSILRVACITTLKVIHTQVC